MPIEPHVAIARWDQSGEVTLWSSTQSPFAQRDLIAQSLGISQGDMRVIGNYIGGSFGSKAGVSMEALAVAMARKVPGRPVKVRLTRMIATAPAIVNAISDVLGIRFNDLPLTAEKIFLALEEQKGKQT